MALTSFQLIHYPVFKTIDILKLNVNEKIILFGGASLTLALSELGQNVFGKRRAHVCGGELKRNGRLSQKVSFALFSKAVPGST